MSGTTSRLALVTLVTLLAATSFVALRPSAAAQDPAGRTLKFFERDEGTRFTHIRNTKTRSRTANSQGDVLAFKSPLVDASGARVGKLGWSCVTTEGNRDFRKSVMTCSGVMTLRDGTLTLQFRLTPRSNTQTGAITGGTGAYANARGVVVAKDTATGSADTITLVD